MRFAPLLLFSILLGSNIPAQDTLTVFSGAKIYPVASDPIDDGVMIIRHGKITGLGARPEIEIPENARVIDASGKTIMPGFVDSHSHIGDGSGGDESLALHPEVRILDAIDVGHPTLKKAIAGGITTVNIMPG